jgi:peptidoglycan/LPS O-acetylase OafA/YrhL
MVMLRWVAWLTNKASRDTSSGQFIAEIDGLRFVAILSVVLYHLCEMVVVKTGKDPGSDPLVALLNHGDIGVQLFFVISGFVIALPFAKGHLGGGRVPQIKQYYLRRLTRLEPPYMVSLALRFVLLVLLTGKTARELLPHLLASLGYLHNLIYADKSAISVVAWSLEVELQFYLLAPFLAAVFLVKSKLCRRAIIVAVIAGCSALSFTSLSELPRYSLSVLPAARFFLTGFLLVDLYLNELARHPKTSLRWDVVSLMAWIAIGLLLFQGKSGRVLLVVPIFVAYCAAFKGSWSNRIFCRPFVYTTGGMCYTMYLYHFTVINILGRFLAGPLSLLPLWLGIIAAGVVLLPVIFISSTIFFLLVEKPCMKKDWYLKLLDRMGIKGRVSEVTR